MRSAGRFRNAGMIIGFITGISVVVIQSLNAAEPSIAVERVRPNKVLYLYNEEATATVTLTNLTEQVQKAKLTAKEEWDLEESRVIWEGDVELPPKAAHAVSIKWNVGERMYGRGLRVVLTQGGREVADGVEFYQVADPKEWFRCFLINAGGSGEEKAVKTDTFITYNNFDNHFAYALSGYSHLAPKEDIWIGGQSSYRIVKKDMLKQIQDRKSIGIRAGAYTIGATGGPAGYELARQHPEWFLRDKKGAFLLAWGSIVSPTELAMKTTEWLKGWYALIPDFGNPEVVQYGGEEIVRAIKMFDFDGMFFDGIYGLRAQMDIGVPMYVWDGQDAGRGEGDKGLNRLSVACVRKTIDIVRASCPNVVLWYNGSTPRPGNPINDAFVESLKDTNCGTLMEIQGAQINTPSFYAHQWRNLYETYLADRNIHLNNKEENDPVRATGYMYNMTLTTIMTSNEVVAARDTWTTANHINAFIMAAHMHPCVLCSSGFRPGCQMMTRYSGLLWTRGIEWVKVPWKEGIRVESNREVWWEEGVYRRMIGEYRDTMVHVVNSPDKEEVDFKVTRDPEQAKLVEVEYEAKGKAKKVRAWVIQPYDYDSIRKEPVVVSLKLQVEGKKVYVELPPVTYHALVVFREKVK